VSGYAEESYEVYREREITARIAHTCDACREPIRSGHRYWRIFCLFDGTAETIKRCLRCQATHVHLRALCIESSEAMWPDERLACGLKYAEEWESEPPEHVAALALMTGEDAQAAIQAGADLHATYGSRHSKLCADMAPQRR
jgi:hypothetical protein